MAAIPHPKPSQVSDPVPEPEDDMSAALAELQGLQTAQIEGGSPTPPAEAMPVEADPTEAGIDDASIDQALSELTTISAVEAPVVIDETNTEGAPRWARFKSKFGQNVEDQRRIMQSSLGDAYDTKISDDEVLFKKKGEKKYRRVDPKQFELISDLTDFAPEVLEGAATSVGAGLGTLAGGPIGTVAGAAGGGALGGAARNMAVQAFGAEPTADLAKEAAFGAAVNTLMLPAAAAGRWGMKGVLNLFEDAVGGSPTAVVRQASKIRQGFDELRAEIGIPRGTKGEAGKEIRTAADKVASDLSKEMDMFRTQATKAAGDAPLKAERTAGKIKELLAKQNLIPEADGTFKMPSKDELAQWEPFGDSSGKILHDLITDYNEINKNGGLTMLRLFNKADAYRKTADFAKTNPKAVNAIYRQLRGAIGQDQADAAALVLKGTDGEELAQTAVKKYAANKGALDKVERLTRRSAEKIADSLSSKNNSEIVEDLAQVFGKDSDTFKTVQTHWVSNILEKSIDKDSGIINGNMVEDAMDSFGKDVVRQFLEPQQEASIRMLAKRSRKLPFFDPAKNASEAGLLKNFVQAWSGNIAGQAAFARLTYSVLGGNSRAMRWLAKDGIQEIAQQTKDPVGRTSLMKLASGLQWMVENSQIKKTTKGGEKLTFPIGFPAMSKLLDASLRGDDSLEDWLERKDETIKEVHADVTRPKTPEESLAE